jgi:hypothetical protein
MPDDCFLHTVKVWGVRDGRKVWRAGQRLFTWDSKHGEVEVFDLRGVHLGVLNAAGKAVKKAVKGRRLNV